MLINNNLCNYGSYNFVIKNVEKFKMTSTEIVTLTAGVLSLHTFVHKSFNKIDIVIETKIIDKNVSSFDINDYIIQYIKYNKLYTYPCDKDDSCEENNLVNVQSVKLNNYYSFVQTQSGIYISRLSHFKVLNAKTYQQCRKYKLLAATVVNSINNIIFYIDNQHNLYQYETNSIEIKKNIKQLCIGANRLMFICDKNSLYVESTKIAENVIKAFDYKLQYNSYATIFLTEDKKLYYILTPNIITKFETEFIAGKVEWFDFINNKIVYLSNHRYYTYNNTRYTVGNNDYLRYMQWSPAEYKYTVQNDRDRIYTFLLISKYYLNKIRYVIPRPLQIIIIAKMINPI